MATPKSRSPRPGPRYGGADIREAALALWPRPEPLDCGTVSTHGMKFTLHQLRRICAYTKSKGQHGYPWLSYSVWSHICKNKLHMTDELAWLFFETFDVVSEVSTEDRLKILDMTSKCSSKEAVDQLRKKISVDTMRFLLLLFIQSAPRLSLKTSVMSTEDWPSPETERKQKSPEFAHIEFIKMHLSDLLAIVSLQDQPAATGEKEMSVEGLKTLEFLIAASPDKRRLSSLTELATLGPESERAGYSQESGRFSLPVLEQWLRANLTWNPFGPHALKCGARDKKCPCFRSENFGKIALNAVIAPGGTRCALLHRINKQTLAKGEGGLTGAQVYIQHCRASSIYLLAPLRSVHIEKCSRCLLVLGTVETVVTLNNCDNLTVITSCRRLHVSSSSECTFHLHTLTRPILYSSSHHLTLSPYNTHYPHLLRHMEQCGIKPTLNEWNNPICLGTFENEANIWCAESPDCYRPISIPFQIKGDTLENPCPIPGIYQEELAKRRERIKKWHDLAGKASLTKEQTQQLQAIVTTKFSEWLDMTGHSSEIDDLEKGSQSYREGDSKEK